MDAYDLLERVLRAQIAELEAENAALRARVESLSGELNRGMADSRAAATSTPVEPFRHRDPSRP
jgi:cell division protein FtsB